MSAKGVPIALEEDKRAEEHRLAFRLAFAAAFGFTIGHSLNWDFPFLPPLFAVQLLIGSSAFGMRQALVFVFLIAAGCTLSILIAQIFIDTPLILTLVIALILFLSFLLLARQQSVTLANVMLITVSIVPLTAATSLDSAYALANGLLSGSILAALLVFLAYAIFPAQPRVKESSQAPPTVEGSPVRRALANTTVLLSLVILFLLSGSPVSVVVLITALTILRQPDFAGYDAALAYLHGNLTGGLCAFVAYLLVTFLPSAAFLLLVGLLFGLIFGGEIAKGGQQASVNAVALVTFLIVLGIGLAPLPGDSGSVFVERVLNVILAAAYTIGLASVARFAFAVPKTDGSLSRP